MAALALSACGGGGGGGSGTPAPSGSITLDKTSIDVAAESSGTAPSGTVDVTISLSGASSPSVTATSTSSGIASVSAVVNSATKATVTITFKSPGSLADGTYDDTVTIKACTDSGCGTALSGSPATVATHYTVSTPAGTFSTDTSTVNMSVPSDAATPVSNVGVSIALAAAGTPTVSATTTTNGVASVATTVNSATSATLTINYQPPSGLAAGTYDDTVTLNVCADAGCTRPLAGSPASIAVHYTITAPQGGSPGSVSADTQSITVSAAKTDSAPTGQVHLTITLAAAGTPTVNLTNTTAGIASVTRTVNGASSATVNIAFKTPASLAAGTYDDTVTLTVCADVACTQPLTNSPLVVNTHYVVTVPATVTVSGKITFDRVPSNSNGIGLNYAGVTQAAARGVVVEAVKLADRSTLDSTTTDASGNYSLQVPSNTVVFIRAKAELLKTGTPAWHFRVLNNTNSNALYALDGANFNSGAVNLQRNLNAPSGWGGSSYTATRASAPFAILDVAYKAASLVTGANASAIFPDLDFFWSVNNRAVSPFNAANGDIETTLFNPADPGNGTQDAIYVLGDADVDTDEFDDSVIAHEWGHYFQDAFSRDDSLGGIHALSDRLDIRVAFSEGWGDAFSGMATGKNIYQDAQGGSQSSGSCTGLESDAQNGNCGVASNPGWYNEVSILRVLWDFYDSVNDGPDNVSLGFGPIYTVMSNEMKTTRAVTSIYPFAAALKARNPASAAGITALLAGQSMVVNDEWGTGETNDAGDTSILPIYGAATVPGTVNNVCSDSNFDPTGDGNKIGIGKFLKFTLAAATNVTFKATKTSGAGADPDMDLYGAGFINTGDSSVANTETFTETNLPAGTYVLEVYEYKNTTTTPAGKTCFKVDFQ